MDNPEKNIIGFNDLGKLMDHPTTQSIFLMLLKTNEKKGVREIQRSLNLKSSSTAHWHLNKLKDANIITQLNDNTYVVNDQFRDIKKLPLQVRIDFHEFRGNYIPDIMVILLFDLIMTVVIFILLLLSLWKIATVIGLLSLITNSLLLFRYYKSYRL